MILPIMPDELGYFGEFASQVLPYIIMPLLGVAAVCLIVALVRRAIRIRKHKKIDSANEEAGND